MLSRIYGVLLPFFVSFLLAYLLDPLVNFVQNKCRVKFRGLSVAIVLLLFVGLLTLSVYLLIPAIGREVKSAAVGVEQYFASFDADKYFTPEQQEKIHSTLDGLNLESMLSYPEVRDALKDLAPKVGGWITGGLSWLAELVVILISLMYLIFLMIDFPKIRANWIYYVPVKYRDKARVLMRDVNHNMNAYFRGQGLVALIVGILFAIAFCPRFPPDWSADGYCDGTHHRSPQSGAVYASAGYSALYPALSGSVGANRPTHMAHASLHGAGVCHRPDSPRYGTHS